MQEQPEDLLGPSRNQSIDKPEPEENINMDGKSQETMHIRYNLIYTMATTSGRKLLIWKLRDFGKAVYDKNNITNAPKGHQRSEYTLYLMSNTVENSRLDL